MRIETENAKHISSNGWGRFFLNSKGEKLEISYHLQTRFSFRGHTENLTKPQIKKWLVFLYNIDGATDNENCVLRAVRRDLEDKLCD